MLHPHRILRTAPSVMMATISITSGLAALAVTWHPKWHHEKMQHCKLYPVELQFKNCWQTSSSIKLKLYISKSKFLDNLERRWWRDKMIPRSREHRKWKAFSQSSTFRSCWFYPLQSSLVKQVPQEVRVQWKKKTMPQVVVLQAGFVARTSFPSLKLFPIQLQIAHM